MAASHGQDGKLEQLLALASELDIDKFDVMLVGDGSGTTIGCASGWAVTACFRKTGLVLDMLGCCSTGTNNFAELSPYLHALWHIDYIFKQATCGKQLARKVRVVIVSDSEVTVRCGEGRYQRKANGALWAAIDWFVQNGYTLVWRHVPRNSNVISAMADKMAAQARAKITVEKAKPA